MVMFGHRLRGQASETDGPICISERWCQASTLRLVTPVWCVRKRLQLHSALAPQCCTKRCHSACTFVLPCMHATARQAGKPADGMDEQIDPSIHVCMCARACPHASAHAGMHDPSMRASCAHARTHEHTHARTRDTHTRTHTRTHFAVQKSLERLLLQSG